jgi:hypothetical protein
MDRKDFTSMWKPMAVGIGVSIIMILIAASVLFA